MRRERLGEVTLWFEPTNSRVERVGIDRDGDEWIVFATSERAAVEGIQRFSDESAALESFIDRARAARRIADRLQEKRVESYRRLGRRRRPRAE